jgi:hypothetical protein
MKTGHPSLLAAAAAAALAACESMSPSSPSAAGAEVDTAVVVLPGPAAPEQVRSGCWATFYDERNFSGDSLTLVGPVDLQSLDRGSARQLRRDIKSLVTGPRATLIVYERQLFSNRPVGFPPDSRESGLVEKLGFGGRIESMQLRCS